MEDAAYGMWYSNGEGLDASLEITFKKKYQITRWEYKNRENPAERNKAFEVEFSNGFSYTQELRNSAVKESFVLPDPQIASKIKFTVTEVYSSLNNGGSFNVYGLYCSDKEPRSDVK